MNSELKGRRNRNEQQWRAIIRSYESSGLSQAAYCRRENLPPSSFQKWRKKLCRTEGSFISVPAPQAERSGYPVEIELASGTIIRVK